MMRTQGAYPGKSMGVWIGLILAVIVHMNSSAQSFAVLKQDKQPENRQDLAGITRPLVTGSGHADIASEEPLLVKRCSEFKITGKGDSPEWDKTEWSTLTKLDPEGTDYKSKFKVLSSEKGIYILFQGEDNKITTSDYKDMDKIWNGDVFEVFFHTGKQEAKYFEYEVNPFEKQLLLTISNAKDGVGWIPFNEYDSNTYGTINKVDIQGGPRKLNGKIGAWSAEVFISYKSLGLISPLPPKSGTVWDANFCRLDHDAGKMVKWSWTATIEESLHELDKFRAIIFQ